MPIPATTMLKLAGVALLATTATTARAERIYGLTTANTILTFDSATPGVSTTRAITGVAAGDTLIGLDLRPADRQLYSLGTSGNIYSLRATAGGFAATNVGTSNFTPSGASFGFDFNPTVDRIRVTSDINQNLRLNPVMPAMSFNDTATTLNGSSNFDLVAVGYRNSRANATSTVLYGLDAVTDSLVRSTNANGGLYTNTNVLGVAFGPLGFSFGGSDLVNLDISGVGNQGYFSINNAFYTIDQLSGQGSFVGTVGADGLKGLTAGGVPEPTSWAMLIAGFGLTGAAMRRRKLAVAA